MRHLLLVQHRAALDFGAKGAQDGRVKLIALVIVAMTGCVIDTGEDAFSIFIPTEEFRVTVNGDCSTKCSAIADIDARLVFGATAEFGCEDSYPVAVCLMSDDLMNCGNNPCKPGLVVRASISFAESNAFQNPTAVITTGGPAVLYGAWVSGVR